MYGEAVSKAQSKPQPRVIPASMPGPGAWSAPGNRQPDRAQGQSELPRGRLLRTQSPARAFCTIGGKVAYEGTARLPSARNDFVEQYRAGNWIGKGYSARNNSPSFLALTKAEKAVEARDYNDYIAKLHDLKYDAAQQKLLGDLKQPGARLDAMKNYYQDLVKADADLEKRRGALMTEFETKFKGDYNAQKTVPETGPDKDVTDAKQGGKELPLYENKWSHFIGNGPMGAVDLSSSAMRANEIQGLQDAMAKATQKENGQDTVYRDKLPPGDAGDALRKYFLDAGVDKMDAKTLDAVVANHLLNKWEINGNGVGESIVDAAKALQREIKEGGGVPEASRPSRTFRNSKEANDYYDPRPGETPSHCWKW